MPDLKLTAGLIDNEHQVTVSFEMLDAEFVSDLHGNEQRVVPCHTVGAQL